MGCGFCKHGKTFMPKISVFEDSLQNEYSSIVLNQYSGPNESYKNMSKTIEKYQQNLPINPTDSPLVNVALSQQSLDFFTASKEFARFKVEYSNNEPFHTQHEYKIFVWSNNRGFIRKLFPERIITEHIKINSTIFDVTFTIYTTTAPIIVDCVLYLLEKIEDFREIYNMNQRFKHVWTQVMISSFKHKNFMEIAEGLGIPVIETTNDLYRKICNDDLKLFKLVKDMFARIDVNSQGQVEITELYNAFKLIREDATLSEIKEGFQRIDVNNDGRISFEEFFFWWKKGRQGPVSFSELAMAAAKRLSTNIPETKSLLLNLTTNLAGVQKKTRKKEVTIVIGQRADSNNTNILLQIGKSAFRENILNEINSKLMIFGSEIWISLKVICKDPQFLKGFEEKVKKYIEKMLNALLSDLLDGKKLRRALKTSVKITDLELLLLVTLDLSDEYMEPLNKLFFTLDELLTSPVSDYISLHILSSNRFSDILTHGNFLKNLGENSEISFSYEYWSRFLSIISNLYPLSSLAPLAYSLFLSSGKVEANFKSSSDFFKTISKFIPYDLDIGSLISPSIFHFFKHFQNSFEDSAELYLRFCNFGLKFKVSSKDLFNIVING